jgi:hypothetical protein
MAQYMKLHGLGGFFIAVALLLTILAVLSVNALSVQQENAQNYYKVDNPLSIERINPETRATHLLDANPANQ